METTNEKSIASLTHLSALSQYIIPFGNYIFPLLIWSTNKEKSAFVNHHGKQVLNFQLSILLYTIVFIIIAIPTFVFWLIKTVNIIELEKNHVEITDVLTSQNITGLVMIGFVALLLFIVLKVSEFFLLIYGAAKSANHQFYQYPLTINFIK